VLVQSAPRIRPARLAPRSVPCLRARTSHGTLTIRTRRSRFQSMRCLAKRSMESSVATESITQWDSLTEQALRRSLGKPPFGSAINVTRLKAFVRSSDHAAVRIGLAGWRVFATQEDKGYRLCQRRYHRPRTPHSKMSYEPPRRSSPPSEAPGHTGLPRALLRTRQPRLRPSRERTIRAGPASAARTRSPLHRRSRLGAVEHTAS